MCIHWPLANGELAHFTWSCVAILLLCGFFFLYLFAIVVRGESFVGYLCSTIVCQFFLAPSAVLPFWGYALFFMSVKKNVWKGTKGKSQCKGRKNGQKIQIKTWLGWMQRLEPFPQRPSSPQVCRRKWPFDPTSGYRPQINRQLVMSVGGFDGLVPMKWWMLRSIMMALFQGEPFEDFDWNGKSTNETKLLLRPKIRLRPSQTYLYQ